MITGYDPSTHHPVVSDELDALFCLTPLIALNSVRFRTGTRPSKMKMIAMTSVVSVERTPENDQRYHFPKVVGLSKKSNYNNLGSVDRFILGFKSVNAYF